MMTNFSQVFLCILHRKANKQTDNLEIDEEKDRERGEWKELKWVMEIKTRAVFKGERNEIR